MIFPENIKYEKKLFDQGIKLIAGVDEVGRGPLAGPFVVGSVILDFKIILELYKFVESLKELNGDRFRINDIKSQKFAEYALINDSKKITQKKRELLFDFITHNAVSYSIAVIDVETLDRQGVSETTQKAFYQAVSDLKTKPEHVFVDGFEIKKLTQKDQTVLIGGDSKSISIGAASILAKVYRDRHMVELHNKYPMYGFDKHKGYGTRQHLEAIKSYGICDIHRKSYEPIKSMLTSQDARTS